MKLKPRFHLGAVYLSTRVAGCRLLARHILSSKLSAFLCHLSSAYRLRHDAARGVAAPPPTIGAVYLSTRVVLVRLPVFHYQIPISIHLIHEVSKFY